METLQRPDLRADFSLRPEQAMPADAEAVTPITRVGRDRSAAEVQIRTQRVVDRQSLAGADDRLLVDARDACRREGVAATRRELLMRVSKRVGLPQAEIARGLGGAVRRDGMTASTSPGVRRPRDPVSKLASMILGVREREVFLARRLARPDDVAALHELAACLGISAERVYELEASARRKLSRALG